MKDNKIHTALEEALEQEIPSSKIRLWRKVQADLAAGKQWSVQQGEKMNPIKRTRAAFVTGTVLVLLTLALITPPGRAFAQSVLRFFTRVEQDEFYMPVSDLTFEETTPFHEECGISIHPLCSVEQVRSKVAFDVKELRVLPPGMFFEGATGGPDFIELAYLHEDPDRLGGEMSVIVEATGKPTPFGTGMIAKSANVQEVLVGGNPGEFYTGILFQDENGNVKWMPDDPQMTLRWEDGGSTYTLFYYSTRYPLTKEDLISLAESMTLEPVK